MPSKHVFSYTRVSTVKQGMRGTSLVEQQAAIERYARKNGLEIVEEFKELETAAKRGRPVFRRMMDALQKGKVAGLIMHKIDRGARNLRDWAEIGELIDSGYEVHFANEGLDMYSRGGRLSADIQAVVAADYIRNLREEVKKGMYGRLKQGLYPMRAPLGYLDQGGGQPKAIDPDRGGKIRELFFMYASDRFTLKNLSSYATTIGLRSRTGRAITRTGMSTLLNNIFYAGIIRFKRTEEFFEGQHKPLVSKALFDKVQEVLRTKTQKMGKHGPLRESFLFRGFLTCLGCGQRMYCEMHKNHRYYRCHTSKCTEKSIRESVVMDEFRKILDQLKVVGKQMSGDRDWLKKQREVAVQRTIDRKIEIRKSLKEVESTLEVLGDALSSYISDRPAFIQRKNELIEERMRLEQELDSLEFAKIGIVNELEEAMTLAPNAKLTIQSAPYIRKREVLGKIIEGVDVTSHIPVFRIRKPFRSILQSSVGGL